MFDPRYQRGGCAPPVGMADDEGARVQVWVPGKGWFDRPADWEAAPEPVEAECEGAA